MSGSARRTPPNGAGPPAWSSAWTAWFNVERRIRPAHRCFGETVAIRLCARCGASHRRKHAWCAACHAAYMRDWRLTHPLSDEARRRDRCRSYARQYLLRGKIEGPLPCRDCGVDPADEPTRMHHEDFDKPLEVDWLCAACSAVAATQMSAP